MIAYEVRKGKSRNCYAAKTNESFTADTCIIFLLRTCCVRHKKYDKRVPGLVKEEIRCFETLCLSSKAYCCYKSLLLQSNKLKFSTEGLNKRAFEDSGDAPMPIYWKVLNQTENVTSTSRGFCTTNHCVATYERTKKGLCYFNSNE